MMKHITLYTLFLLLIFCISAKGQTKTDLPTAVITTHGPKTSVRIIRQDKKGDLWLASNEGIIRYDGRSFTNITGEMNAGRFLALLEAGTSQFPAMMKISLSNKKPGATEIAQSLNLFGMVEVNDGSIWFGSLDGVYRYDGKNIKDFK
jgi:ligand-binding sensor domain-containing protein